MRVVGFLGIAASIVAFGMGVAQIWGFEAFDAVFWDWWIATIVVALALAHASLLLLTRPRHPSVRVGLAGTLILIGVLAAMIINNVVGEVPTEWEDAYWRVFGVVAILDVLGTITVPILDVVLGNRSDDAPGGAATDGAVGSATGPTSDDGSEALSIVLSGRAAVVARERAAESGRTPAQVVEDLLLS